jgi:hypothetical protein
MRFVSLRLPTVAIDVRPAIRAYTAVAAMGVAALLTTRGVYAQNTPFISNLNQTSAGLTMFTTTSDRFSQSFTPSTNYSSLIYAKLNLSLQSSSISTSDTVHLYLFSDGSGSYLNGGYVNANQPASQIADLGTALVNSTIAANYSFSSSTSLSLTSGQIYWLVLQDDANSNAGWSYTTSTTYTGPATINSSASSGSSPDAGNSWIINGLTYTDPNTGQTVPYGAQLFEVGTAAGLLPEPGSFLLFTGGLAGVAVYIPSRRRRYRHQSSRTIARDTK